MLGTNFNTESIFYPSNEMIYYNQPIRMIYCIMARGLYSNAIIDSVQNLEFKEKLRIHLSENVQITNVLQIDT
jgi:hypothetical protein